MSLTDLRKQMQLSKSREQFQRWQVIYLLYQEKYLASEVAGIVGVTTGTVYQWVYKYNRRGISGLLLRGRGGRTGGLLTWEEEETMLSEMSKKAEQGILVIAQPIREHVEKKLGRYVSKDYIYDLLHRHGWRKVSPRPKHPNGNEEQQEEFKKKFRNLWTKPLKAFPKKTNVH